MYLKDFFGVYSKKNINIYQELFEQFGEITRCEIDWDEIGRSKVNFYLFQNANIKISYLI